MSERGDDFLSRWSRRKAEARGGDLHKKAEPVHKPGRMRTDAPEPKQAEPVVQGDAEAPLVREATLREEQSPAAVQQSAVQETEPEQDAEPENYDDFDFDSLNYKSDYTRFMKQGVPEAVRRRALRMLWQSNPILANIDGLNDYDEDFTDAALAVKILSSSYKPGIGYLTEEERIASYSEEARKVGPQLADEDAQDEDGDDLDGEDSDVEDMDDDDQPADDIQTASTQSQDDVKDDKASSDNDTA